MANTTRKFSKEREQKIIKLYYSGFSTTRIAKIYVCSPTFIYNILNRNRVKIRRGSEAHRKYSLNEHAFDKITPESAYWIGFLMADGNIYKKAINLFISFRDINHIRKFLSFLKTERPIIFSKNLVGISIESKILTEKLISYGVTPRKSLTAKVCKELSFNKDFWRGVIDGDGSIIIYYKNENNITATTNLTGSEFICKAFKEFVESFTNRAYLRKTKSVFAVDVAGKNCIKLLEKIYQNSSFALDRKVSKAKFVLEIYKRKLIIKGRDNSKGKNVVLNREKVVDIKKYLKGGLSPTEIAKIIGVKRSLINNIKYHNTWKSVVI